MKPKSLTILGVIYGSLLIYASLMPFDFTPGHADFSFSHLWNGWPIDSAARISGSDLVSNLALYAPLGWFITVRCRLGRLGTGPALVMAILVCSAVSVCVELAQITLPSRTASAADWLLNTISGFAGATLGVVCGKGLWVGASRWLRRSWRVRPVNIATLVLMALLAADALVPFMPTILLKQVWQSLKRSHFDFNSGLALHPWHWWVVTRILVYAVLTMLIAAWGNKQFQSRRWLNAVVVAACFALSLELVKPMIVSRSINSANVLTSCLGCFVAVLAGGFQERSLNAHRKLELSIAAILVYVFYLAWTPFNFVWEPKMFQRALFSPIQLLPFYHYAMGAELNHVRLFVQSVFLQGILVYLMRVRFGFFESPPLGIIRAALFAGALGLLLEVGQIFLPSRTPSMTDVYCFAIGGGIGAWIRLHPTHALPREDYVREGGQGIKVNKVN